MHDIVYTCPICKSINHLIVFNFLPDQVKCKTCGKKEVFHADNPNITIYPILGG